MAMARTTVDLVRQLGAVKLWSPDEPCDAARVLNVRRTTIYAMARSSRWPERSEDLPIVRVGRRGIRVPVGPLLKMIGADNAGDAHVSTDAGTD